MPAADRYVVRASGRLEVVHSDPNRLGCEPTYGMDLKEAFVIERGSSQIDLKTHLLRMQDHFDGG